MFITIYILSGLIGGALVLISAFTGSDTETDTSLELAEDTNIIESGIEKADGLLGDLWLPILSLRFWTYFAAAFGITGLILEVLEISAGMTGLIWALIAGSITGLTVAWFMRALSVSEHHSGSSQKDLIGVEGEVTLDIHKNGVGKIRCKVKDHIIDLMAVSREGTPIKTGEKVVIIGINNSQAEVARTQDVLGSGS